MKGGMDPPKPFFLQQPENYTTQSGTIHYHKQYQKASQQKQKHLENKRHIRLLEIEELIAKNRQQPNKPFIPTSQRPFIFNTSGLNSKIVNYKNVNPNVS